MAVRLPLTPSFINTFTAFPPPVFITRTAEDLVKVSDVRNLEPPDGDING